MQVEADELCRLAAQMIDWLQGYDVPNPMEELGGAIVAYRKVRATSAARPRHRSTV